MKLSLRTASIPSLLVVAAACASTNADNPPPSKVDDPTALVDAAASDGDGDASDNEPDASAPTCSQAGWCKTDLPDLELTLTDIWPLPDRAIAIAEGATLGVKVLEWTDADGVWKYIDDNSQNEEGLGRYSGKIWAPTSDEVYYGVSPRYIYHGKRLGPPGTAWSWSRSALEDNSYKDVAGHNTANDDHSNPIPTENDRSLGVWGTAADDVYAWHSNTLYRRKSDGTWAGEYVVDDYNTSASEHIYFFSAAGSEPDDVWFVGSRMQSYSSCALAVRKTNEGYRRIVDGDPGAQCSPRTDIPVTTPVPGRLSSIQSVDGGIVGINKFSQRLARISPDGSGYAATVFDRPADGVTYTSIWTSPTETWVSGFMSSGTPLGIVLRASNIAERGTYNVSSIAFNGAPVAMRVYQVRGTSNTNLWAIGSGNAFHKTTP